MSAEHASPPADEASRRVVVGVGEFAVSDRQDEVLVTPPLGSCVAVCVWDPVSHVSGVLNFLLPDSRLSPARAKEQPAAFADAGIPLLLQQAASYGLQNTRCDVRIVGGAELGEKAAAFDVGKRNVLAAKNLLWRSGLSLKAAAVGGTTARAVAVRAGTGRVLVTTGRDHVDEL
jgi:chemotaxis protein CheD